MSASKAAAQKKATEDFISAWKGASVDGMLALRTPDCIQHTLPSSTLGMGEETNEQFEKRVRPALAAMCSVEATVPSVTHDIEAGRSVVHSRVVGELPFTPYANEHVLILTFTEDGTKMTRVEDMLDSACVLDVMKKMEEFQKTQVQA